MRFLLAVLLWSAATPVAAVDLVGRELGPRGTSRTTYPVAHGRVAFAGDRFLTVWTQNMGHIGVHLMGTFSDVRGQRVTPLAFPVIESLQGQPLQLVGTGDSYALFWRDSSGITRLTDIGLDGRPTRTTTVALPHHIQFDAGWNGTRFLAALRHPVGQTVTSEGFVIARSGEVLRRGIQWNDSTAAHFHIAGDGDGFIAATFGFGGVTAYRITGDGVVTQYAIDDEPGHSAFVSTTANGELLVVFAVAAEVSASIVTLDGQVQSRGVLAQSSRPMSVVHVRLLDDHHLVTYLDLDAANSGLWTLALRADGQVTPAPQRTVFEPRLLPPFASASSPEATLTVYTAQSPFDVRLPLLYVAIANDGLASEPDTVSIGHTRQTQPILSSDGARVFAAWTDMQGYNVPYVRTAELAPDATQLTDGTLAAPASVAALDVAWNGSEYLVVQVRFGGLYASRVRSDGTELDAQRIRLGDTMSGTPADASVVWAGDRWVVVWRYGGIAFFTTVRGDQATPEKQLQLGELSASEPALAFNGSTLLVAWNEEISSPWCYFPPCARGPMVGKAARLTLDGELADETPLTIPQSGAYVVATSGSEFFILGGTTATIVDANATRILASRKIFDWPAAGDVTWDGSSYAVALRYRGAQWHLSATHFDRELNVVGTPRGTPTLPPDDFVPPSIAGPLIAVQEGDAVKGARAVVYREAELLPLPAPPVAPRNVRWQAAGNNRFEITWDESPGAELYRVTVFSPSGHVWSVTDLPATAPRSIIAQYPSARVIAFNAGGPSDPLSRRRGVRR